MLNKETKEIDKCEFVNFNQSVTTEEFMAVLELVGAINDNFERALVKKDEAIADKRESIEKMEKELGKYDSQVIHERRNFSTMEEELDKELSSGYKVFLRNYDGAIEFLTRFNLCGTIKKRNIANFLKTKNGDNKKT